MRCQDGRDSEWVDEDFFVVMVVDSFVHGVRVGFFVVSLTRRMVQLVPFYDVYLLLFSCIVRSISDT